MTWGYCVRIEIYLGAIGLDCYLIVTHIFMFIKKRLVGSDCLYSSAGDVGFMSSLVVLIHSYPPLLHKLLLFVEMSITLVLAVLVKTMF